MRKEIEVDLRKVLSYSKDLLIAEPLKNWTTWRIGGPAEFLVFPRNTEQVVGLVKIAQKYNLNKFVLGNGSNVLIKDGGLAGLVINTKNLKELQIRGNQIFAQSGVLLHKLATVALKNGLTGLEFSVGIPASFGGAVLMNAGAWGSSIGDVVKQIKTVNLVDGEVTCYDRTQLNFRYRESSIQKSKEFIISGLLELTGAEQSKIKELMDLYMKKRLAKQPYEMPNAGSVFKNPAMESAGLLIESVGLKGRQIGDAKVSEKHANFIVNCGNATAEDVLKLIDEISKAVEGKYGISLEKEINIFGT